MKKLIQWFKKVLNTAVVAEVPPGTTIVGGDFVREKEGGLIGKVRTPLSTRSWVWVDYIDPAVESLQYHSTAQPLFEKITEEEYDAAKKVWDDHTERKTEVQRRNFNRFCDNIIGTFRGNPHIHFVKSSRSNTLTVYMVGGPGVRYRWRQAKFHTALGAEECAKYELGEIERIIDMLARTKASKGIYDSHIPTLSPSLVFGVLREINNQPPEFKTELDCPGTDVPETPGRAPNPEIEDPVND
jgi:hypothetical protein